MECLVLCRRATFQMILWNCLGTRGRLLGSHINVPWLYFQCNPINLATQLWNKIFENKKKPKKKISPLRHKPFSFNLKTQTSAYLMQQKSVLELVCLGGKYPAGPREGCSFNTLFIPVCHKNIVTVIPRIIWHVKRGRSFCFKCINIAF